MGLEVGRAARCEPPDVRRRRLVSLALVIMVGAMSGCTAPAPEMRILFIGNSYTATNDLPQMVASLADSAGVRLETEAHTPGGWWLRDHAASTETVELIESGDWDVVVLQEQSMVPAARDLARSDMFPAAIALANTATTSASDVILFETWGHRGGSAEVGHSSYGSMQAAITATYAELAGHLRADVAPVGQAWASATAHDPGIALHQGDGSHPTRAGTYLAAIVITATILEIDPTGFDSLGLDDDVAALLKASAANTVGATP